MTTPNLTADDRADLARFLREAIEADRYPLSPGVRRLKALLAKLEPARGSGRDVAAPASRAKRERFLNSRTC